MINAIYTKLHNELPDVYCTRRYEPNPKSLPCLYFRETHFRPRRNVTLNYDDQQINCTVTIEVFAKDGIRAIIDTVESEMNSMYFIEESCIQVDNADITIMRYIMTFSRIICEGDNNEM